MKIGSQDESDSGDPITTKKTRMLMIMRMIKGSQDKSNGKEHCNNENTRWQWLGGWKKDHKMKMMVRTM